jgi:hypothetical protein
VTAAGAPRRSLAAVSTAGEGKGRRRRRTHQRRRSRTRGLFKFQIQNGYTIPYRRNGLDRFYFSTIFLERKLLLKNRCSLLFCIYYPLIKIGGGPFIRGNTINKKFIN